ncbi:MAG: hypothetical protein ACXV2G_06815 [Actinomycetes bacterium]
MTTSDSESSTGAGSSGSAPVPGPHSHRRAGPAAVDEPSPSFPKVLWENPREPLLVAGGSLLALGWGVSMAVAVGSVLSRALGVVAAVAGLMMRASYVLRLFSPAFASERWSRTRPRQVLRAAAPHWEANSLATSLVKNA